MNIHIFGHVYKQKEVAQLYIQVLAVREDLNMQQYAPCTLPCRAGAFSVAPVSPSNQPAVDDLT